MVIQMIEHELQVLIHEWREGVAGEAAAQTAYDCAIKSRPALEASMIETQRLPPAEAKRQADLTVQVAGKNWMSAQNKHKDTAVALYDFLAANPQLHRLALQLKSEAWANLADRFASRP